MSTSLARTFAALSAINEAILYAKSPDALYQMVCDAGFSSGDFMAVAVFLVEPEGQHLHFAAGRGDDVARLRSLKITTEAGAPEGSGVGGEAFRSQKLCISNDYLNDPRSLAWREGATKANIGAAAALPLLCNGKSVGVLFVTRSEAGSLTEQMVSLFERMSANISYALENFARETARQASERTTRRLNRMFGALSATNEAILRAKNEQELYQLVCDASVHGGKSLATFILLKEPDSHWLKPVAGTGENLELVARTHYSTDPENPYGRGISGEVFRTQKPIIERDLARRTKGTPWEQPNVNTGVAALIAAPLVKHGQSIGVILAFLSQSWAKDDEVVSLMLRIAENVCFAIDNFDREAEKAQIAEEEERLARMYAALSATNEAILRAHSRAELFDLVCEATAKGAKFTSAAIALVDHDAELLRVAACYGPNADSVRNFKLSTSDQVPEGRGLTGTAFRTRQPCISNDVLSDDRIKPWAANARRNGIGSAAALPLFNGDRIEGVFVFNSPERGTFTPEFVELLQRLQANVAFALNNFDRADERARAEAQKERLTRMFAALSATNEAIVRAKSRTELFELVCRAASTGGKFTSTTIALASADSDRLAIVASAGPSAETTRNVRLSVDADRPEGQGMSGTAFRTRQPCICNDYVNDSRVSAFHAVVRADGARSGAAFPLIAHDKAVGVMIYMSTEQDTFTSEFVELLHRLADNVSFAMENFDRADEKNEADERIEYLASHDSLTDLPNRETFNGLLRGAIDDAQRHDHRFALLFIDLDRFKVINDSLGHEAGDLLLLEVANRLRGALRASDVVARLGGDEFVVILDQCGEIDDVQRIATGLLAALAEPMELAGHECHTTASIGIAMYPANGADAQTLTKNADMAMYLAKEDGKNGYRFFSNEVKTQSIERLSLESALRRALEREQFSLNYQPKVDMETGQITGVEALLRWNHPDLGSVSPAQFIPLAEETGLIVPIGRWVLNEACAQAMTWQRCGLLPLSMAVNLSPRQFADEHLLQDVDEALAASGMSPVLLQLEVTESMMMRNVGRALKVLDAIQSRGIRLAIDDFGTGYSSMSLMKHFPIDTIKIDRSFVRDLPQDSEDQAIAQAIISMGKALGMTVVAEGVENAEQEAFLRTHGCDEMQGFLIAKPLPAKQMAELLRPMELAIAPPLQPETDLPVDDAGPVLKRAVV
ncbi:diguanylate cyclase [Bradyrhizobium sp. CCBAU 11434]|uniref:EAL domain-containing protein n=1 Tax=Bradyrhizobium zhengyangense TaxID=2911009 RepID=A0ABS9LRH0_9BRAD|nr:EAL domain-containing protein [Bradyrhizobium sp. CCBAU 11434]MCG2642772.1 EAL domain-containing protein [Bradyrhizobium zhengyangense]MCG2669620.1 EAL domain-containing protein [Bradyrhizobium zhengyangense]MDA9525497.1 diguanylate cyclase [Bradyrhizobium sp. CCBAU 11434]